MVVDSVVFDWGSHPQCGVAPLPVVEDLTVLEDSVGQLDSGLPALAVQLVAWMESRGCLWGVGVDGTGCYGAGLARHLTEAAARAALNGEATSRPKGGDRPVETMRPLPIVTGERSAGTNMGSRGRIGGEGSRHRLGSRAEHPKAPRYRAADHIEECSRLRHVGPEGRRNNVGD